jgi:hypothetical protein
MSMQANSIHSCFQKDTAQLAPASGAYYVELPLDTLDDQGSLLDSLIQFAFDTLHIRHLDLRIIAETH